MIERVYYSTYDYGRYLGTYSVSELQAMIHCGVQVPGAYANAGRPYRGRYMFERSGGRGDHERDFAAEWDKARLRILRAAGR